MFSDIENENIAEINIEYLFVWAKLTIHSSHDESSTIEIFSKR